jgi:hypothetical protein
MHQPAGSGAIATCEPGYVSDLQNFAIRATVRGGGVGVARTIVLASAARGSPCQRGCCLSGERRPRESRDVRRYRRGMRVFRRLDRRAAPPADGLIIGEDLAGSFHEPGRHPTQADLDRLVRAASSVVVRDVFSTGEALYETDDLSDLTSLRDALRSEGEMGHCTCTGTLAFVFRRDGEDLGTVTLHHGESLQWDPFFYNAPLVESDPILDWLTTRGMPSAREEYDDARRHTADAAHAVERWRAAMPRALDSLWLSMSELSLEWPEVADVMSRKYPDAVERARVFMEWFGQGEGPWSGYPSYEHVPEWCLLQMPFEALVRAAQAEPQSAELLEGAARLFAGWSFGNERGSDLAKIPSNLRRELLGHALRSADEDRRDRARRAFGD